MQWKYDLRPSHTPEQMQHIENLLWFVPCSAVPINLDLRWNSEYSKTFELGVRSFSSLQTTLNFNGFCRSSADLCLVKGWSGNDQGNSKIRGILPPLCPPFYRHLVIVPSFIYSDDDRYLSKIALLPLCKKEDFRWSLSRRARKIGTSSACW